MSCRLIIADDHPLIRAGFREALAHDSGIQVVGEAADGNDLLKLLRSAKADVVALDINMPGPGFLELIRRIRKEYAGVRVLVVSMYPEGQLALEALQAGAAGYATKTQAESMLISAVRTVCAGGKFITPSLAERLATELQEGFPSGRDRFSPRERRVLGLLVEGKSYKEIAAALSLSPKTVGTYRSRVLAKLKLKTTADLIRYALEHGFKP